MQNLILASHGSLAEGMLSAANMIVGDIEGVDAYGLDTYHSPQDIYQLLKKKIAEDNTHEYIILCDIYGGSVHNQLMHLCVYPNVFLLTGMTLSIVLELILANETGDIEEKLLQVIQNAKDNMLLFTYQRVHNAIDKRIEDEKLW